MIDIPLWSATPPGPATDEPPGLTLYGADGPACEEQATAMSAHLNVTAETPPTFLWHTANDNVVPVDNSLLFAAALARAGTPFELHVFPEGKHGLGLAQGEPAASAWPGLCATWLATRGFGSRP